MYLEKVLKCSKKISQINKTRFRKKLILDIG